VSPGEEDNQDALTMIPIGDLHCVTADQNDGSYLDGGIKDDDV
jgi:hypothetical protein